MFAGMMLRAGHYDSDRFDRSKRIGWMDIDAVHRSRCLVAGAGALGNEVVKNLVLSGFRDITIVDMDHIVMSNLNRCVFFRSSDIGIVGKADILAERASEIDHDVVITPRTMRIQDMKEWDFDIAFGCLDNIAARLHLNSHCVFHGIPYVDGATDGMRGKVQTVLGGPCLQCTMNRTHINVMNERYSCTPSRYVFVQRTAAEITTTSVIAAMQVREALKIVSGRKGLCTCNAVYYNGETGDTETLEADIDPNCPNHGGK
jgi:molybdopterin/thiamine biosynthesis adenylyltransferase